MICNVFLYISAWFLCEKEFKIERIVKVWGTVFIYSIIIGLVFFYKTKDIAFLIRHIFPISSNVVWYISMYIGILILSPALNILLKKENRKLTQKMGIFFFVAICVIPTFYPKTSYPGSVLTWFSLAYLLIGIMRLDNIKINSKISFGMFVVGWGICLWFYNSFDRIMCNKYIGTILKAGGFYREIYFQNLATLPCCLAALGIFFLFLQIHIPRGRLQRILRYIEVASLDVYIVASMEAPNGKLGWVELWKANYAGDNIFQCYAMICIGVVLGVVIGNMREYIWNRIVHHFGLYHIFYRIDNIINKRETAER